MVEGGIGSQLGALRPKDEDEGVLRLLAEGMSLDPMENRLSSEPVRTHGGRDPKAILARAAALVREKTLSP
jgi:hypothetical protein